MTFEELKKANESVKTTNIRGKEYAEVNQRIKVFRMLHPNGSIQTNIESIENGMCVMRAVVFDADGNVLGIGHAYEKEGSSNINKTSYIENCETSAVGRALGMCGIGIDVSIASKEEVENAIHQQEMMEKASQPKITVLKSLCEKHKINLEAWLKQCKTTLDKLTEEQATQMLMTIKQQYGDE